MLFHKLIIFFLLMFAFKGPILAQEQQNARENSNQEEMLDNRINLNLSDESLETRKKIGSEASKSLYKVLLDSFEMFSQWSLVLSDDFAYGRLSRRLGVPLEISQKPSLNDPNIESEKKGITVRLDDSNYRQYDSSKIDNNKSHVLGARITFRKRGHTDIIFKLENPFLIGGLAKNIEVWVSGRQRPFTLYSIIEDIYGNDKYIEMGRLDFLGWKRMTAHIPRTIIQYDYLFPHKKGIKFKGFLLRCDPLFTKGTYYIYFDELSVEMSQFIEEYKMIGNPTDTWE